MIVMMIVMPTLLLMKVYKHSNHDWCDSYLINFIARVVKILSDTAMPSHTPHNMAPGNTCPLLQHHHSFSEIISGTFRLGPFGVKNNALCDGTSQKLACCSNLTPTQHMQYYINDSKLSYEVQCWSSPMGVCYVAICCVRMTKSNPQVCWWINRQQTTNRRVTRDKWLLAWAPRSGGNFNSSELQLLVA